MLLVYFGLAILVYMQFGAGTDIRRNRNVCIAITVFLFLISAMKSSAYRPDVAMYAASFERVKLWTYRELFDSWMNDEIKDGGFYILSKVFGQLGFSDYGWLAFVAFCFAVGVGWFIYRNSAKPVLSLMLLMTLEYFRFSLSGLRQAMAIAVIFMFSYSYMIERRPIRFVLSVLIAAMFHSSAILFLPAYLIAGWRMGWKQIMLVFGMAVIYFLFPNAIRVVLSKIAWTESVASYATSTVALTWSGFAIHSCILLFCVLFRNETVLPPELKQRRVDVFINCMIVGLCLQMMATMIAEAFRLAYYYNMCCIAVVPNLVVENKRESNHSTMYLLLAACLVAYMLWSRAYFDMIYFWQG